MVANTPEAAQSIRCELPILKTLGEDKQRELFERAKTLNVEPDEIIFEEGEIGHSIYVIKSGAVRVLTTNEDGQQIILTNLQAGDCFGEQAILSRRTEDKRHISVVATEPGKVFKIALTDFYEVVPQDTQIEKQLQQITDDKIRKERKRQTALASEQLLGEGTMEWLEEQTFKDGEVVFEEGDTGDQFYLILEGAAKATKLEGGNDKLVSRLSRGQYFGEMALIEKKPRDVTITADGHLRVTSFKGEITHDPNQFGLDNLSIMYNLPKASKPVKGAPIAYKHYGIGELSFQIGPLVGITAFGEWPDLGGEPEAVAKQSTRVAQVRQNLVKESSLFSSLPFGEASIEWLEELQFEDGAVIFQEGEVADRFYLILSGMVKVTKKEGDNEKLVALLCRGQYFGEVALIRNEPRSVKAVAEGPLQVASLKGLITFHASKFMEMPSLTTIYHFPHGNKVVSTKVVDNPIFDVTRMGATLGTPIVYKRMGARRELFIQKGRIVGMTIIGEWPDLGRVQQLIIHNWRVWPWQLALFRQTGELWLEQERENFKANAIVCKCMGVTRGVLNEAFTDGCDTVDKLAERTGASRVCGSCAPQLAQIVGHSDLEPVDILAVLPVTSEVKSFRFRPKHAVVHPSLPGQHIRIEAKIEGRWVQRSYTLTSPAGQHDYYEISVKREEYGLFSRWLHDKMNTNSAVRVSKPQGSYYMSLEEQTPAVCYAGGIGMTPSLAILRTLHQMDSDRSLFIDYSAQKREQFAYVNELTEIPKQHNNIQVNLRATEEHGFLQAEDVKQTAQTYQDATFYICGPKPFEQAVRTHLEAAEVPTDKIKTEHFVPAGGSAAAIPKLQGAKTLLAGSILTFLVALYFMFFGPIPFSQSVQSGWQIDILWTDSVWKQVTGYTILALTVIGMGMSLRKRWRKVRTGNFAWWRIMHLTTGLLALALLFVHTGMKLGEHFNLLLMIVFMATLIIGSTVGLLTFIENRMPDATSAYHLKTWLKNVHIAIVWPLPVLIGIHIVLAYYF
jgi:ferredoxin-NADP reductase/CRP-like cAMP-binding protein